MMTQKQIEALCYFSVIKHNSSISKFLTICSASDFIDKTEQHCLIFMWHYKTISLTGNQFMDYHAIYMAMHTVKETDINLVQVAFADNIFAKQYN